MMFELVFRFARTAILTVSLVLVGVCAPAWAQQDDNVTALSLVRSGMESYAELDLDTAKAKLEEALAMTPTLSPATLARIHVSFGVIWSGGFADTAKGQESFTIAACYDPNIAVDPLFLTPEIETEFKLAKMQATPDSCRTVMAGAPTSGGGGGGSTVVTPPPTGSLEPCGVHHPLMEQKQKFELPFFVTLSPAMSGRVVDVVVKHSFDAPRDFKELAMTPMGGGHGALLSCNEGEIRIYDPSSVYYFIEGRNSQGQVVCSHGSAAAPMQVSMMPDAQPLAPIASMQPKECTPCAPWDEACRKETAGTLPGLGDFCQPSPGCAEGLKCGEMGICEMDEDGGGGGEGTGPKKFYVNVMGGTGVGFASGWDIKTAQGGEITTSKGSGFAWGGIPLRFGAGIYVSPKFSIEVTGRFDVWIAKSITEPQSCADGSLTPEAMTWCTHNIPAGLEVDTAHAQDGDDNYFYTQRSQYAWLVNARARFKLLSKNKLALGLFGGLGFGHIQYRVPSTEDAPFFPLIGVFDIEIGPSLSIFFNDNIGLHVEIPIDVLVGDGFGLNFDFALGLGFGF